MRVVRRPIQRPDQATRHRVRVTSLAHTALFGSVALGTAGRQVLDRALLRKVELREVQETLDRNGGRTGAAQARKWMVSATDGTAAESERLFLALMRDARIQGWSVNRPMSVRGRVVLPDFRLDAHRLIVEIAGWAFHSDPAQRDADSRRQNALILSGYCGSPGPS